MSLPRDFKGIWIPKELWLDRRLSIFEKCVLAEIDSLDCGEEHCFASNEYLAEMFNVKETKLRQALYKLKKFGLIEQIAFDGRTRVLKSNIKTSYSLFNQSECRNFSTLHDAPATVSSPANPIERENKVKNKAKNKEEEESLRSTSGPSAVLASKFKKLVLQIHEKITPEPNIKIWATEFDKMLRLDKWETSLIEKVMEWALNDPFWQTNIVSPKKLRLKFTTLKIQMENQWKKPQKKQQELVQSDPNNDSNLTAIDILALGSQE